MIVFADRPYYLDRSTGYWRAHCRAPERDYLHRDVWRAAHGNIPHGWEVHHKVADKATTNPDDLECLPFSAHLAEHKNLQSANGRATVHHTRRRLDLVCEECGKPYRGVRGRWCSKQCANRFHNRRQ
jgi:HNH endonuclease